MALPDGRRACVRVHVSGRVQGVAFRWHALERARALGVTGWVRNLTDGRVEAWLEGEAGALQRMLDFLAEGPPHARVDGLERRDEPSRGYREFTIERRPTL